MTLHTLSMGSLYLMSGPPASGKSTLLKNLNLPEGAVISSDSIRNQLYGVKKYFKDGVEKGSLYGWDKNGYTVFAIMAEMINARLREGLTTFVDAMNLEDSDRKYFIDLAQKIGCDYKVMIFNVPLDELHRRNNARYFEVSPEIIDEGFKKLQRTSEYPYITIEPEDTVELTPLTLKGTHFDVVGDCHGLLDDFLKLLKKLGYQHNEEGVPYHPEGRQLVFLGDVIDRGQQSVLMLHYVEQAVRLGGHYFIPGNHEEKLARTWEFWIKTGEAVGRSRSNTETFLSLMKQPMDVQERLIRFIQHQPAYRIIETPHEQFACVHSDIEYFNPLETPRSGVMYGSSFNGDYDTDLKYQEAYEKGLNQYTLLRGHVLSTSLQNNVHSIEFDQAYDGDLAILQIDKYVEGKHVQRMPVQEAFNYACAKQRVNFNYQTYLQTQFKAHDAMVKYEKLGLVHSIKQKSTGLRMFNIEEIQKLIKSKHVKEVLDKDTQKLSMYKYSKSVFWDNLWKHHPFLEKARGLVLDMAGNIVQHPFDKIFNYGENGTALHIKDEHKVQMVEKLNGFLGCITKHPYKENELLVTTTGSFDSDFVGYIQDFITPDLKERFLAHFKETDETLMFEVIHPKDNEHPVSYKESEQGLWLIGAREKKSHSKIKDESYLDWLGTELQLRRPKHQLVDFKTVRDLANTAEGEGYIVRDLSTGEPVVKFKTTNYLAIKMLGRLSTNNIKFMYAEPEKFKQRLDEEYGPIVDIILKAFPTAEQLEAVARTERMNMVRDMVREMRVTQEPEAAASPSI